MGTIADKFDKLIETKADIKEAITEKGQSVSDVFSTYGDAIRAIETGTDTSDATALASDILSGKTAYGATGKLTGTIPSQNATTITPGTSAKTAIPAGTYAAGKATVAGDANLVAGNIKEGISIFGVTGSFAGASVEYVSVSISVVATYLYVSYIGESGLVESQQVYSGDVLMVAKNSILYGKYAADSIPDRGVTFNLSGDAIQFMEGSVQNAYPLVGYIYGSASIS